MLRAPTEVREQRLHFQNCERGKAKDRKSERVREMEGAGEEAREGGEEINCNIAFPDTPARRRRRHRFSASAVAVSDDSVRSSVSAPSDSLHQRIGATTQHNSDKMR